MQAQSDESMIALAEGASRRLVILVLLMSTGCAWTDAQGTRHALIVGFGLVSTKEVEGVTVQDSRGVGILAEPGSINAGWVQRNTVAIDPKVAPDVILSVGASPLSLKVESFTPYATRERPANDQRTKGGEK